MRLVFGLILFSLFLFGCTEQKVLFIPNDFNIVDVNEFSDVNFLALFEDMNLNFPDTNNSLFLNGVPGSGYIRTDGSSTTTASIPFAEGLTVYNSEYEQTIKLNKESFVGTPSLDFIFDSTGAFCTLTQLADSEIDFICKMETGDPAGGWNINTPGEFEISSFGGSLAGINQYLNNLISVTTTPTGVGFGSTSEWDIHPPTAQIDINTNLSTPLLVRHGTSIFRGDINAINQDINAKYISAARGDFSTQINTHKIESGEEDNLQISTFEDYPLWLWTSWDEGILSLCGEGCSEVQTEGSLYTGSYIWANGNITTTGSSGVTVQNASPTLTLVDTSAASDDYLINVNASSIIFRNVTDLRTDISVTGDGNVTIGNKNKLTKVIGDLNVSTKIQLRVDGNITMTSPDGTIGNCGMGNDKVFRCS